MYRLAEVIVIAALLLTILACPITLLRRWAWALLFFMIVKTIDHISLL
jgi:lysylphosphatidylglycerol synthetase-like protein (DUF2156 family)